MTTFRWIAVVAAVVWCAGVTGGALASDTKQAKSEAKVTAPVEGKININEASQAELMKLEGVGAGTAKKIIAWREAHGPFKHAHDLEKVPGVGREVFGKNHGRIAVK
ncbi:MAG TPA: ComEA family DNA-binding protein [Methylomirabilota bacterium]|jgi:competence ComEA-like helix-hairpin-helix protein